MVYEPQCGGGGDCAHAYERVDGERVRCQRCGHCSNEVSHRWKWSRGGSATCTECLALLWPS